MNKKIKEILKIILFSLRLAPASLQDEYWRYRLDGLSTEDVFTNIYRGNRWFGKESVSGQGSNIEQTKIIIQEIPTLIRKLEASTFLDIPCGDFFWMSKVDLTGVNYLGADIVEPLILKNIKKYAGDNIHFKKMNLIADQLPAVDIVFCRDCLVHLSYDDIFKAISNVCTSESVFLVTTTFPSRTVNENIKTGEWRTINFEIAPFHFPKPLQVIDEGCTEYRGAYSDKALGVWRIEDIKEMLREKDAGRFGR